MTTTVNLDRILGLLLSPADAQRLSLGLDEAIQAIAGRHQSFSWGVCNVEYVVRTGVLVVQRLDVVLPNGLHIARDDDRLRLDLRPLAPGEYTVHLTATLLPHDAANRFLSYRPATTADEVLGADGIELPRVRTRLALVTSPPASPETSMALLKVRHVGNGRDDQWSEVATFVPPVLKVQPDSRLGSHCRAIAERLRREAEALAARANASPATLAILDLRTQLAPLATALAGFEAVLTGLPHPFTVYVELCRLAAAVSLLRRTGIPASPPYDHNDLWTVFDTVARSFAPTTPARLQKFTFQYEGPVFRLAPDEGWARTMVPGSPVLPVLAMESDAPQELAQRWGENCIIGSRSRMPLLESRRILGPVRTPVTQVDGVPADRRTVLFAITPDINTQVTDEDLLVLSGTPDITPTALHLYVAQAHGEPAGA